MKAMQDLLKWAIVGGFALGPAIAMAQEVYPPCPAPPTEQEVTAAKGAFEAGKAAFDEADYARAITYWEDAYRRDCTAHLLLQNLSRAYELSGQKQQAVVALQTYLERMPDAPKREQIEKRIEVLKAQMEDERRAAAEPPPSPRPEPVASPAPQPAAGLEPTKESGRKPVAPLILAGAGGLMFIGGGVGWVIQKGQVNDFRDRCPEADGKWQCPSSGVTDDANKAQTWRNVWAGVSGAGLVAAVGGIVWYAASKPSPQASGQRRPLLLLGLGPTSAGVEVRGRF